MNDNFCATMGTYSGIVSFLTERGRGNIVVGKRVNVSTPDKTELLAFSLLAAIMDDLCVYAAVRKVGKLL